MAAPQQGVELLFPVGTGKHAKGAKLSKEENLADALLKKLKTIEKGGDINAVDKRGQTALMYAAAADNRLAVCWLVAKGADVTLKSKKGKTARDCSTTIAVRELLRLTATEKTALTKEQDKEYELVKDRSNAGLHAELKRAIPYVSDVAVLLKLGKVDLNAPDADGALVLAYKNISAESSAYCIRHGADVHKRNGKGEPVLVGNTPDDVALLLLSLGLKTDEAKPAELPASFLSAVYTNDCDKVKALTTKHPDLAKKVRSSIILSARSAEMAHALIDAGADYKECWYNGGVCKTRLCAVLCGTPAPVIKVLIDAGAVPDDRWEPEIGLARDAATVEVLIAAGQSPNVKSKWGKTALESALEKRHWEAAECLIAHGAELTENILNKLNEGVTYTSPTPSQSQMNYGDFKKWSDWREREDSFLKMPHMLEVLLNAGAKIIEGKGGTWYEVGAYLFSLADCEDLPMEAHLKAAEDTFRLLLKNSKPPKDFLTHMRIKTGLPDAVVYKILKFVADSGVEMPNDLQSDIALHPVVAEFLLQRGANPNLPQDAPMFRLEESNDPARLYAVLRKYKARVDISDKYGNTPLHRLCDSWVTDPELVHAMIRDGADVNARNKNGITPLHWAKGIAVVQALIQDGADVNARDSQGNTPLFYAKAPSEATALIQAGADVNAKNNSGQTPLFYVGGEVITLLINAGADVHVRDERGRTPIFPKISGGRSLEDIETFARHGLDINTQDNNGNTALMNGNGDEDIRPSETTIQALLKAGADPNIKNKAGKTALQIAREKKLNDIVKVLQKHEANEKKVDPNAKDKEGRTPLMQAALDPDGLSRLKECIAQKGDVNARDNKGCTALRLLFGQDGDINDRVQELLNAKADVNLGDSNDFTPLMTAACYKDTAKRRFRVQRLINARANVNAAGKAGNTAAMHLLLHYDDPDTLRMLLDAGAKPDHKNGEGKTLLDIASENHRSACLKLLNERFPASSPGHQ